MQLSSIPQLYRNVQRWREILAVLRRYGLADWLSQFSRLPFRDRITDRQGVPLASYTREARIRLALTELGPTFIKLGQILSSRPDLAGPSLAEELQQLQASVPPDPPDVFCNTLQESLRDRANAFGHVDDVPLAAASIGQVHGGTLANGQPIVIKIQRQGIQQLVHRDLEVLAGIAQLAQRVPALAPWRPADLVRQLTPMLLRELDFDRERQNLRLFRRLLADDDKVVVPEPFDELSSSRVLAMERLNGTPIGQLHAVGSPPAVRQSLARHIADVYAAMVFRHGVFHADPHPGNLLLLDDGRLGIVDFGMIGRLDDRLRERIGDMLLAINAGDGALLTRLIKRTGNAPPDLDESSLAIDVADYLDSYASQSLDRFNLAAAINDLSGILHRHRIELPGQSALLLKMLVSLSGALATLDAHFNTLEAIRPYLRRAAFGRLTPKRQVRQMQRIYLELERLLEVTPDQVVGLLDQARQGRITLKLEHRLLGASVNRLVSGLIASALFLGSTLLLSMKVPPLLFQQQTILGLKELSIFGTVGLAASLSLMVRLVFAINRSGHLDRDDEKASRGP
jgi:ubiquinone biosynthesis protein